MDNKVCAVQLIALKEYAEKQGIPPHCFVVMLKYVEHGGITLEMSNLEEKSYFEENPPTLFKLTEMAFLHFPNQNEDELFAVFGRLSDGSTPKTVAHVELRKHLSRDVLDHVVIMNLS